MIINIYYLMRPISRHFHYFFLDQYQTYQSIAEQSIVIWKAEHKIHLAHPHPLKIFLFMMDSTSSPIFILGLAL